MKQLDDEDLEAVEPIPLEAIPLGELDGIDDTPAPRTPLHALGWAVFGIALFAALAVVGPTPTKPFETPNETLARAPERTLTEPAHVEIVVAADDYEHGIEGDADFPNGTSRYDFVSEGERADTVISTRDRLLVSAPQLSLPRNAHWVDVSSERDAYLDAGSELQGALPYLEHVNPGAARTGTETFEGENVTHYEFTLNVTAALARHRGFGQSGSPVDQALMSADLDELTSVPAEAWLDGHRHVRKVTIHVPQVRFGHGFDITTTFTRVGQSVDVTFPEPGDIISLEEASRSLGIDDD